MIKKMLVVIVAMAFVGVCFAEDKIQLKYAMPKGWKGGYRMKVDQNIEQTMMGQQQTINQKQEMVVKYEVIDVEPNGVIKMKQTFDAIKINMTGSGMNMNFDSADPNINTDNPMAAMYSAMLGRSFIARMTPQGKMLGFEGLKEMMQDMVDIVCQKSLGFLPAEQQAQMTEEQKQQMKDGICRMMNMFLNDDNLEQMSGQNNLPVFPEMPVGVGDSWPHKLEMNIGLPLTMDTTYTVQAVRGNMVAMAYDSVMDMKMGKNSEMAAAVEPNMPDMKMDMAGTIKGVFDVDKTTGWTQRMKADMNLEGKINAKAGGAAGGGAEVPMKITGTMEIMPL